MPYIVSMTLIGLHPTRPMLLCSPREGGRLPNGTCGLSYSSVFGGQYSHECPGTVKRKIESET